MSTVHAFTGRGGDVAIGALATLIYLGEYLGQGAIANKAYNTGSVTALATAAFGTLLTLCLSGRRNPLAGPRFLSVVCYASILDYAMSLQALKNGGVLQAFALASLCVSASGVWLLLVYRMGWEGRFRALMSLPSLSALAFIVAATTIAGQLSALNNCTGALAWPAITVAVTVVGTAFGLKYSLQAGSLLHRARLCVALAAGSLVYFAWRSYAPTPTLCGAISQIQGEGVLDALLGAWLWPLEGLAALMHTEVLLTLLVGSGVLALVCLIDTVSAASSLANDEGKPDADTGRELQATGWGNLVGGLLGLLPISLSLSRSRTVAELKPIGTKLPAISHAATLLLLLICLVPLHWPLLEYLPKASIAGALIVVSIEMLDDKSILLWRAGFGAKTARTTMAAGMWIFLLAIAVAVCVAMGPMAKLAVTSGFAVAIAGSLLGLMRISSKSQKTSSALAGNLHFLNIGWRLRQWRETEPNTINLSATTHVDFTAACALADLARANEEASPFVFSKATGAQVHQVLAFCYPQAFTPAAKK